MDKARILIADDHQILAEGIRGLLEPEFEVVGVVSNGRELVAAAKTQRPDVIVADISMPSLNGIEAAIQIRDAGLTAKVVFLTMHRDVAYARQAMEAGAAGYVLKHSVSSELVTAIHDALQGKPTSRRSSPENSCSLIAKVIPGRMSHRNSSPRASGKFCN